MIIDACMYLLVVQAKITDYLLHLLLSIWNTVAFREQKREQLNNGLQCIVTKTKHALNLKKPDNERYLSSLFATRIKFPLRL